MPHQERVNIAVFIDFDNIEIGVKNTLGKEFDVSLVLEALKERGEVVTKIAYGDWTRAGEQSRALTQHAVHMVQRNVTPRGDKNGADINLALDALEMAFTHHHINAFAIVGGDSDFIAAGREAEAVRQAGLRGRRAIVHQRHPAAQLPRVHRVREPGAQAGRRGEAGRSRRPPRPRSRRRSRWCGAPSRSSPIVKSRRRPDCSRARCCSWIPPSRSATTAPHPFSISPRSSPSRDSSS